MKHSSLHNSVHLWDSTFFLFCFSDIILFLSGWLLMRNATLSCITFLWMNIRVRWSFQAVGVKTVIISLSLSLSPVLSAAGQTIPRIAFVSWPIFIHHLLWPNGSQTLPLACPKYHLPVPQWGRTVYHPPAEYSSLFSCLYISLYFSVSFLHLLSVLSLSFSYVLSITLGRTLRKRHDMSCMPQCHSAILMCVCYTL